MEIEGQSYSNPRGVDFGEEGHQSYTNKEQRTIAVDDFNDDCDKSQAEKEQFIIRHEGDILSSSLMGIKREKVEEIYDLYCNHALEVGFSVRRSTSKYNIAGVLVLKWLVCSCEGIRRDTTSSSRNNRKKNRSCITRTNCKASLKIKLNVDGLYEVVDHNTDHNHTLSRKQWSYINRSQRSVSTEEAKSCIPWRHQMVRKYSNLVLKAQDNEEARTVIEDGLNGITLVLEALVTARQTRNVMLDAEILSSSHSVADPSHSITKGRKQRMKHHLEKSKKKKKKTSDALNPN